MARKMDVIKTVLVEVQGAVDVCEGEWVSEVVENDKDAADVVFFLSEASSAMKKVQSILLRQKYGFLNQEV